MTSSAVRMMPTVSGTQYERMTTLIAFFSLVHPQTAPPMKVGGCEGSVMYGNHRTSRMPRGSK